VTRYSHVLAETQPRIPEAPSWRPGKPHGWTPAVVVTALGVLVTAASSIAVPLILREKPADVSGLATAAAVADLTVKVDALDRSVGRARDQAEACTSQLRGVLTLMQGVGGSGTPPQAKTPRRGAAQH
jgi:hypothetical protein